MLPDLLADSRPIEVLLSAAFSCIHRGARRQHELHVKRKIDKLKDVRKKESADPNHVVVSVALLFTSVALVDSHRYHSDAKRGRSGTRPILVDSELVVA